ncbi:hypothetical protein BJI69_17975 [Luteibacter rhizovicinus DSM 16549]|uniref:Uncharacterized protein n=1 Tax=Luteibacter rhizovicinus DSM 16549 TaxID=1440763 RepID=A0A0G9HBJ1_9GAMM|nr:hypothetical protein [Luteibacter rhizovicinus]APG05605.1 hypothetical protein BJI69_17975 [Luteibacter rhizovicinus DSM 16549]KLD67008.1 hypothetical protein Y883_10600 [Luteibacter rhizovicinus DSM 16549]KLD79579.1 hypothetical protein Y886_03730 [Xanthomonas hyacinthi DSM 19077]
MAIYNVAVVLWQWGPVVTPRSKSWYESYFFNQFYGQAAYWLKQSDGDVILDGQVFDWVVDNAPVRDFSARGATSKLIVDLMEGAHGVDLTPYNSIIVVLGLDASVASDGGSCSVTSRHAQHHALIMRAGDPFDFVSHELGHGIVGPPHSFTWNTAFQVSGEAPGGYGHRHCIMSAMAYGWFAEARHSAAPPLGAQLEYQTLGPSINGVTANARGWIDTQNVMLTSGFDGQFEIRARQWMGRDAALAPQGLHLTRPDGNDYVIEFYENSGWDAGLSQPYLIVTQDKGEIADLRYPGKHSGTYLRSIPVGPSSAGGLGAAINLLGPMGVMPIAYDPVRHVLRVRLADKVLSGGVIAVSEGVANQEKVTGSGHVTFKPGERFCVSGDWRFDWIENRQTVTIDATHPLFLPGSSASWAIDGIALDPAKTILALTKTVTVPDPKLLNLTQSSPIEIGYKIEPIPNGSRLTLTNRPQDNNYSVEATVTLSTQVASGSATRTIDFTGRDCRFPPEFQERWSTCMAGFLRRKLHDSQVVVVFDPSLIHKVPPGVEDELAGWLGGLAHRLERGDQEGFELAAAMLRHRLRMPEAKLHIVKRDEGGTFPRMTETMPEIPPAAEFPVVGNVKRGDTAP